MHLTYPLLSTSFCFVTNLNCGPHNLTCNHEKNSKVGRCCGSNHNAARDDDWTLKRRKRDFKHAPNNGATSKQEEVTDEVWSMGEEHKYVLRQSMVIQKAMKDSRLQRTLVEVNSAEDREVELNLRRCVESG